MSDDPIQTHMLKICYIRTNLSCRREWSYDFKEEMFSCQWPIFKHLLLGMGCSIYIHLDGYNKVMQQFYHRMKILIIDQKINSCLLLFENRVKGFYISIYNILGRIYIQLLNSLYKACQQKCLKIHEFINFPGPHNQQEVILTLEPMSAIVFLLYLKDT